MSGSQDGIGYSPGSGVNIAGHVMSRAGETQKMEAVAPGSGVLELPGTPQISGEALSGEYPVTPVSIEGAGRFVVKTTYTDPDEPGPDVRFKMLDYNDKLIGYTDKYTVNNLGIEISGEYIGDMLVMANEMGAKSMQARLLSDLTSGEMNMYVGSL
jgi:hypothetical protein